MELTLFGIYMNFEENLFGSLITAVIMLLVLSVILNSLGYTLHLIHKHFYFKGRNEKFIVMKQKYKINKIYDRLERLDDFNKLPNRYKRRLEKYMKFLLKDLKFQVFLKTRTFTRIKRVSKVKVDYSGALGTFQGNPKRVFKKATKQSRRNSGFLYNLVLFEELVKDRKIYGIKTKDGYIQLSYVVSWWE